jgi:predicted lipid-binding transport protein (Tim44 family)
LAEQTSLDIANHVENVGLVQADVREPRVEDTTHDTTIGLRRSAHDYTVSLTKPRGEPGYLVEGSEVTPTESGEVWTFMRYQNGKWLLSAIQQ